MDDKKYLLKQKRKLLEDITHWVPHYESQSLLAIKETISELSDEAYVRLLEEYIVYLLENNLDRSDMPFAMYYYFFKVNGRTKH